jgi:hypothetical protein
LHQLENGFDVAETDVRSDSQESEATPFDRVQFACLRWYRALALHSFLPTENPELLIAIKD